MIFAALGVSGVLVGAGLSSRRALPTAAASEQGENVERNEATVSVIVHRVRIGVLGGTYDPIHLGHLIIASELRHALTLDRVLFVPAAQSPFVAKKLKGPPRASDADRLAMLELALTDAPGFEIDRTDIDRPPPSRSAELLAILTERLAPVSLVFLMGEDALRDFPAWYEPATIVQLAELGVASRPGFDLDHRGLEAVFLAVPSARGRVHLIRTPRIEISATDIRARIEDGRPISFLVPRIVERYIIEQRLYRA